jgi:hypothetical protein
MRSDADVAEIERRAKELFAASVAAREGLVVDADDANDRRDRRAA